MTRFDLGDLIGYAGAALIVVGIVRLLLAALGLIRP